MKQANDNDKLTREYLKIQAQLNNEARQLLNDDTTDYASPHSQEVALYQFHYIVRRVGSIEPKKLSLAVANTVNYDLALHTSALLNISAHILATGVYGNEALLKVCGNIAHREVIKAKQAVVTRLNALLRE